MATNDNMETILGVKLILPSQEPQTSSTPSGTQSDREPDQEYDVLLVDEIEHYTVKLGRQGENDTQNVRIDCSDWLTELPSCQLMIAALRPGEREIYVPEVTVSNGVVTWPIMAQDTALAGIGRAEVRALLGEKVKKSVLFKTRILPALDGDAGGVPTTPPDWARAIMGSVEASQAAAEAAQAAAEAAEAAAEKGLSDEAKEALLNLLQHVVYTDGQGQSYYDALAIALSGDEVTSLTAVYSPGTFKPHAGDSLDVLRPYLTVTAHFSGGNTATVHDYTLSGTMVAGSQTITVGYMGKSTTFTATVYARTYIANFDFKTSMTDLAGHYTPELSAGDGYQAPTRTSEGLKFTQPTQRLYIGEIDPVGKTFEFDVADFDFKGNTDYHMRLFLCCNKKTTPNMFGMSPFVFKANTGYNGYAWTNGLADLGRSWSAQPWSGLQGESARSIINGKTVKLVFEDSHTVALYIGGQSYGKQTDIYYNDQGVVSDILRNCKHISFGSNGSGESSGDQCYDLTLSGFRVYANE